MSAHLLVFQLTQLLEPVRTSMSQGDRLVLWLAKDIQVCPEASKEELL